MDAATTPRPLVRPGVPYLVAAWWMSVVLVGLLITGFSGAFVPPKFTYDAAVIRSFLESRDLWQDLSFDGYVNTSRAWSLVLRVLPEEVVMPGYFCLVALVTLRLLGVFDLAQARYQLLAAGWLLCASLFLAQLSKEMIAMPVALALWLPGTRGRQVLGATLFLLYAAFFRQYWAICFFYYLAALLALRLHVAHRSVLAACILLLAFVLPFVAASVVGMDPLTGARTWINADRIDSPDARSAFDNTFENTGLATDLVNAVIAWFYMNLPVTMLLDTTPHYVVFAIFQLWSLGLFVAGCARYLRDARQIGHPGAVYLRSTAFVIAYSATLAIFEPDFGSFFRHEMILMLPMLIIVFHAGRSAQAQASGAGPVPPAARAPFGPGEAVVLR